MKSTARIRKRFEGKNLFTVKEAAEYLGFAPNSLRIWDAKEVLVPSRTAGNQRRYSKEQLDGFTRKKYERIQSIQRHSGNPAKRETPESDPGQARMTEWSGNLSYYPGFSDFKSLLKTLFHLSKAALITVASLVVAGGVITFLTTVSTSEESWLRKLSLPPSEVLSSISQKLGLPFPSQLSTFSPRGSDNNLAMEQLNNDSSAVLAEQTLSPSYLFRVRIPSQFDGVATFKDNIILGDKKLEAGTINALELTAGNVIYSVKAGDGITVSSGQNPTITNSGVLSVGGKTGAVTLTAGTGITIDGTKITNSLPESNQNLWKTFTVGSTSLNAGSTTDTFTFTAGEGIALALDTTNKKLTVTGVADPGITDDGTVIRLSTITDNVGFGTTSPLARLDVRGNSGTTPAASISAQSSFAALVVDNKGVGDIFTASSSGLNRFVITQNGNVGIGTANPAFKLEVDGHIGPTTANGYDLGSALLPFRYVYAQNLVSGSSGTVGLLQRAAGTIAMANITDDLVLGATATSSATVKLTGTTNAHSWFNLGTGNVGIGTTAPNYKLEVAGTFGATGNITLGDTTADTITFTGRVASIIEPSTGSQYDLGSSTRPWANVYADNITTSGNVSMSGTTQADFRINQDYAGADGESSTLTFERGSPAVNAALKWNASDVSPSYLFSLNAPLFINPDSGITMSGTSALIVNQIQSQDIFTASASGTTRFTIANGGNVGINDTTPDYLLELYDATNTPTFGLSDDDIAHGVTTVANTDTFFHLSSISTTDGGAYLQGLADATGVALQLRGIQSSDPTDTTPAISLIGAKASGTGVVDLGAAETVFQVANNDDTAAISVVGTGAVTVNTSLAITGTEGSTVSTVTAGDAVISDGSLAITDDDDAASFSLTNNTATTIGAGINTAGLMDISSTSLTTGNLVNLETTTALTSGRMLNITSTSTALTSGNLLRLDWTPGSATTATGDLFTLNIGANGTTTGNLFNILDSSSSIFSVSETAVTTSLPANFTAAGDVSMDYDLYFTNPTASFVKSLAPITIQAGPVYSSSNLTLKTYNQGSIVLSQANTVASGATSYGVIFDSQLIDNAVNPTTHYSLYNVPTSNITGDTLTTMYGDYIGLTNSAGTITTWYGQYIAAPTGSGTTSTKYAFVTEDASGNVGFGDTTPDYLLELYDATNTPTFGLSDDDIAHGVTTVAQTDSFFHLSSISTTVGGAYLQGLADATGVALQLRGIQSSDPTDTTPAISLIGAKASGTGVADLAAIETVFQVANNDDTAAMTILGNGNVGIGTTTPEVALDIGMAAGDILINNARYYMAEAANGNNVNVLWVSSDNDTTFGAANGEEIRFTIGAENDYKMTIVDTNSYVGIGTTTPLATLDLRGTLGTTPAASISATSSFAAMVVDNKGVGDIFTASSSGLNRFVVKQDGNVGVGVTDPGYLLELKDDNTTPAFALSDDDIAHGVTTVAQTDSFFHLSSISTTDGGAYLQGLADNVVGATALQLRGIQASDPTDTVPAIKLIAAKASGTGVVDLGAAETVFQVANNDDTAAISVVGTGAVTVNTSLTITGTEGSTVSTVTAGDAVISDGSLAITDDDDAASFSLTNNTATTIGAGINTAGVMDISSTSLTTGNLLNLETTTALTTGRMLNITSTSTALTTGNLLRLDWTPGSATTATGDLFTLNIGANGTAANLLNILDSSSSIFSVSETAVTTSLPTNFTSSGDVSIAYDINFTNPTASFIKSNAPMYIQAGKAFNSSDLTLKTYNQGSIVLTQANTVASGATSYGVILDSQLIDNAVNPTTHYSLYNVPTSNITGDTLTTMYGDYIGLTNSAGTVTTWYGQYIAAPTGSGTTSNKYALVTEDASGNVGLGDTTPDYLLELYDATNTPAFALSDDDIAHGVTTVAQTDSFFHLSSISTTVGGAYLQGLADATGVALQLRGIQSSDPTDTTPAISLIGAKASGTGVQDLAAAETVFQVANNDDAAAFTILGNGSMGIKTTDIESWHANYNAIEFTKSSLSFTNSVGSDEAIIMAGNAYMESSAGAWTYKSTDEAGMIGVAEGILYFRVAASGTADTAITWTDAMRITNAGNVGINATSPLAALDVRGNLGTVPAASVSATSSFAAMIIDNTGVGDLITASTSGTTRFTVANNGNLTVVGSATTCTIGNGTGATNCTSDIRLKDNIVSLDSGIDVSQGLALSTQGEALKRPTLEKIMKLNPVNFTWKNNPNLGTKTGLIAQEVQEVFPEFVNELPGGYLGLDYAGLVSPVIKAVQEQQWILKTTSDVVKQVQDDNLTLASQGEALQGQVASLSARLSTSTSSLRASETSAAISEIASSSTTSRNDANNNLAIEQLNNRIALLESSILNLQSEFASYSAVLGTSTSSASLSTIPGVMASALLQPATWEVSSNSATISGQLMVLGRTTLSDLGVTGNITAGILSINGMDENGDATINTLGGVLKLQTLAFNNIEMMAGKVTIDTSGNITTTGSITTPQIVIDTTATASATLGSAILPAFSTQIIINTTSITANSKIFLTPTTSTYGQSLFIRRKTNGTGFTVGIDSPFFQDIKFDWWLVEEKTN